MSIHARRKNGLVIFLHTKIYVSLITKNTDADLARMSSKTNAGATSC